jgi:hypothetical protein
MDKEVIMALENTDRLLSSVMRQMVTPLKVGNSTLGNYASIDIVDADGKDFITIWSKKSVRTPDEIKALMGTAEYIVNLINEDSRIGGE